MSRSELLKLTLNSNDDTTGLRHIALHTTRLVGMDDANSTRVATSVSELARIAQHHLPVTIELAVVDADQPVLTVTMTFDGTVPDRLLTGQPAFTAIARLMDGVEFTANRIELRKAIPQAIDESRLEHVREQMLTDPPRDLRAMLQSQNEELLVALVAVREREVDLLQLNAELDATNRGVVALYAELEQRSNEVRTAQRAVFEELERALRPSPPQVPGLELDVCYVPAEANSPTGGDLYDWLVLPDGTVHITVVDVQGHGVVSTRDALLVTHTIRTLSLQGVPVGEILARADALLQTDLLKVTATVLLARIAPTSGVLQLASGGHPPALHIPSGQDPSRHASYLDAYGRPIGYDNSGSDQVLTVDLAADDTILLYTDGLIEIRRDLIEGMATLEAAADKAAPLPLPQLLDTILVACAQGSTPDDDTLLLAARWRPTTGS